MNAEKGAHTILVVDDDANILASVVRLFRSQNFITLTANSGEEALQLLSSRSVDLLLCDETMPGMRGNIVLRKVKELWPDTVRIMITANADLNLALQAINEGEAYRFILKPWNDDELIITVKQALERFDLVRENYRLAERVKSQESTLANLEQQAPGITSVKKDDDGYYIIST
jgi:two-component system, probable response regulator PhcQ